MLLHKSVVLIIVVELPRFATPKMRVWMKQLIMFTGSYSTAHNPHPNVPSSNRTAVSLTETVSTVTSLAWSSRTPKALLLENTQVLIPEGFAPTKMTSPPLLLNPKPVL